jgi:hypothetical protein
MSRYRTLDEGPLIMADISHAYARNANPATEPLPVTFKWIAQLPHHVRPFDLLRRFPQVANALATTWPQREACRSLLYELLDEGNRKDFRDNVVQELLALRSYFEDSR